MRFKLYRFKPTEAYLRIIGNPRDKWTVKDTLMDTRRRVKFFRALYYWMYGNVEGWFPSLKGE